MFENGRGGIEKALIECANTSSCASMISGYLLIWFLTKLVDGSVRSEWQNELTLSIEKVSDEERSCNELIS